MLQLIQRLLQAAPQGTRLDPGGEKSEVSHSGSYFGCFMTRSFHWRCTATSYHHKQRRRFDLRVDGLAWSEIFDYHLEGVVLLAWNVAV